MNDLANQGTQPRMRDTLIDAILFRIEQDVEDAIPSDIPIDQRKGVLNEILPNSRFILEALTIGELKDDLALERHVAGAIATATYLSHRIAEQRSRK